MLTYNVPYTYGSCLPSGALLDLERGARDIPCRDNSMMVTNCEYTHNITTSKHFEDKRLTHHHF